MTKNYTVKIPNNNYENRSTFGGLIYFTDFYTNCNGRTNLHSPIASRILQDRKFDKQCKKNLELRSKRRNKNDCQI